MEYIRTTEIHNFKFTSFVNDSMASYFIESNTTWEPHLTNFVTLYKSVYDINIKNCISLLKLECDITISRQTLKNIMNDNY